MKKNEVIVIADIGFIGKRTYLEEVLKLPYRFVWIRNSDLRPSYDAWGRDYFSEEETIEASFRDPHESSKQAWDELQRHGLKPKAVCTYAEIAVPFADQLAKLLGLPRISSGDPLLARNKFLMREAWKAAGLCQPDYYLCKKPEDLDSILNRIKFPIVVKPTEFFGSAGVLKFDKDDRPKIREAYLAASQTDYRKEDKCRSLNLSPDVIIESYIPAEFEISCEAVVFEGQVVQSFLTKKYLTPEPYFYEVGHSTPLSFGQELDQKIDHSLALALQFLKVENCVVCAEFRIRTSDREPVLVEIAARMGGDFLPFLVKESTGCNLFEACVDIALGIRPQPCRSTDRVKVASIHFIDHDEDLEYLLKEDDELSSVIEYEKKKEGRIGDIRWLSESLDESEKERREIIGNY